MHDAHGASRAWLVLQVFVEKFVEKAHHVEVQVGAAVTAVAAWMKTQECCCPCVMDSKQASVTGLGWRQLPAGFSFCLPPAGAAA
jgi:hypothetical protein